MARTNTRHRAKVAEIAVTPLLEAAEVGGIDQPDTELLAVYRVLARAEFTTKLDEREQRNEERLAAILASYARKVIAVLVDRDDNPAKARTNQKRAKFMVEVQGVLAEHKVAKRELDENWLRAALAAARKLAEQAKLARVAVETICPPDPEIQGVAEAIRRITGVTSLDSLGVPAFSGTLDVLKRKELEANKFHERCCRPGRATRHALRYTIVRLLAIHDKYDAELDDVRELLGELDEPKVSDSVLREIVNEQRRHALLVEWGGVFHNLTVTTAAVVQVVAVDDELDAVLDDVLDDVPHAPLVDFVDVLHVLDDVGLPRPARETDIEYRLRTLRAFRRAFKAYCDRDDDISAATVERALRRLCGGRKRRAGPLVLECREDDHGNDHWTLVPSRLVPQRDAAEPLQAVADPVAAELENALETRRTGADPKALRRALRRIEELLDE